MKIQVTLTVSEAKYIIAKAIIERADVKNALQKGKVLLKGGTTVSVISEILTGQKLRIGGRISPRGTMNSLNRQDHPHCVLIENKITTDVDKTIEKVTSTLEKEDVIIVSGNALDIDGNVAMMAAAPLGHNPGKAIGGFSSQGSKVIIPIGLEKLIPGTISNAIQNSGRISVDKSMGAAIGLIPLIGEVVTEKEAISSLATVKTTVIAAGGIDGAEGSTTLIIDGSDDEAEKILGIILSIKGAKTSGLPKSLPECNGQCPQCKRHLACVYKEEIME
ncbi:MAG: hypothetical protein ACW98F_15805 [Candidatus Hodarchaeales archaeon]|jgi:hypothetical protein